MKDYSDIIQDIKDNITENGKGEITGRDLREILLEAIGNVSVDIDELDRRIEGILGGENYDDIINSWAELEQFLSGLDETANLAEILSYKADKDQVYNKSDIDTKLGQYTKTEELGALALKDEVAISDITNLQESLDGKLDKVGGEIDRDLYVKGQLSMGTLILPNKSGQPSAYSLSIGELGAGADTPEGGGGGSYVKGAKVGGVEKPLDVQGWINLDAYPDVSGFATTEALAQKQDKIDDLGAIRSGAALGATALQSIPSEYITDTELEGKGYATTTSVSETYATKASLKEVSDDVTALQQMLGGADSDDYVNSWQEITDFLDEYKSSTDLSTILSGMNNAIAGKVDTTTFNALATRVGTAETNITNILDDYLSKANGGTIKGAVTIQAALKMNTLYLPNSNNTPSDYALSVGSLGSGADTPEGGGSGIAQVTINVNGSPYKTDANGVVTLPNYPTSLPASDVYDWAKAATKPTYTASEVGALSTSGGTLTSTGVPLIINRTVPDTWGYATIEYKMNDTVLGYLGFDSNGDGIISPNRATQSNYYTLIHSGNIGDYALKYTTTGSYSASVLPPLNSFGLWNEIGAYVRLGYSSSYNIAFRTYNGNLQTQWNKSSAATDSWKTIAFTDSNVASATKLQTARTIWGQSFDGTGNIDSGINVSSYFNNNSVTKVADLGNKGLAVTVNDNRNHWGMCFWTEANGKGMIQQQAFTSAATTYPISLQPLGGNVLIGTTTDNGAKLQVAGGIRPSTTNSYALGGSSYNWTEVWCRSIINNTTDGFLIGSRSSVGATNGGALIYSYGNTHISFYTNNTERMWISGSGEVNITSRLQLRPGTNLFGSLIMDANNMTIQAVHDGVAFLPISLNPSGGNVLIGTTTDDGYKFAVNGGALANTVRTQELRLGEASPGGNITQNKWYYASIGYEYTDTSPQTLKPDIVFKTMYDTYAEGSGVERMRIKSNGYVGIGTADPKSKLDVNGNISASGDICLQDTTGTSSTSYKLWLLRRTISDDYWDYGIYAQSTKGLTFVQSANGVNTDIAWLDGNGNFYAKGYQLPTSAPSNPVSGGYYLYVGTLGAGATIS